MICEGENCTVPWCRKGGGRDKAPPVPKHNPAPEHYGYDVSKVPGVACGICGEDRILDRFGQMFFLHKDCQNGG